MRALAAARCGKLASAAANFTAPCDGSWALFASPTGNSSSQVPVSPGMQSTLHTSQLACVRSFTCARRSACDRLGQLQRELVEVLVTS